MPTWRARRYPRSHSCPMENSPSASWTPYSSRATRRGTTSRRTSPSHPTSRPRSRTCTRTCVRRGFTSETASAWSSARQTASTARRRTFSVPDGRPERAEADQSIGRCDGRSMVTYSLLNCSVGLGLRHLVDVYLLPDLPGLERSRFLIVDREPVSGASLDEHWRSDPSRISDQRDSPGHKQATQKQRQQLGVLFLVQDVRGEHQVESTQVLWEMTPIHHSRSRDHSKIPKDIRASDIQRVLVIVRRQHVKSSARRREGTEAHSAPQLAGRAARAIQPEQLLREDDGRRPDIRPVGEPLVLDEILLADEIVGVRWLEDTVGALVYCRVLDRRTEASSERDDERVAIEDSRLANLREISLVDHIERTDVSS